MQEKLEIILESIKEKLGINYDDLEFQELESMLTEYPYQFAREYNQFLSEDDQKLLGYFKEIEYPEPISVEELLRIWPKSPQRPELWSHSIFESMKGKRQAILLGCN
jgi:hypothetical protein